MMRLFLASITALLLIAGAAVQAQATDPATGLVIAEGWESVQQTCTECHSAQLITQNAGSAAVWKSRIVWMQETQGLQQLSAPLEASILDYLAAHYGPRDASRRANLASKLLPANPYPVDD